MNYEGRIAKVRGVLADNGVDALLVTNLTNARYLTGFSGTNAQVLITGDRAIFFSDPRYEARAATLVEGAEVRIYPTRLTEELPDLLGGVDRLGLEGTTVTLSQRDSFAEALGEVELVTTKGVVEDLRRVKEAGEVALIRDAVRLADDAFAWIGDRLAPGRTEREVALDLEVQMRSAGADDVSFEPIVGSGELSAHIHHTPSERVLRPGDLLLLDFGCTVNGYCSDLTRTVALGEATDEQRSVYATVLEAQSAGIAAVGSGVAGADCDAAARRVIEGAGHGTHFGHGLGHGLGLEVHEAPRLHRISEDTLDEGNVVTVEPGIYVQGDGGIRIEDCVLVTGEGAEVLGKAPKDELIEFRDGSGP
jgi:Xaa-Pro aminopeptidase